jgi:para-nitrobenzyl esterase
MSFATDITRRNFLAASSTVALGAYAAQHVWGQTALSSAKHVVVETKYGRVRGAQGDGLVRFRGIPYGGSVSGQNRFKAAPPPSPWPGVRDALEFGAPSMQPGQRRNEPPPAEDCLFLNVWTPAADGRKRPVMLYSHGGGFTTGSGGAAYQDGSSLARTWDVVVVATNHRLGLLGYLYLGHLGGEEYATSGNQGIEDIRDGLRWIHDNIERFGGDPNNVMIFGESGGGGKTSTLYAMPSAAEYFNKASIESGPGLRLKPLEAAVATTDLVLKQLGLQASQWRQLLEVPADQLVQLQGSLGRGARGGRRGGGGGGFMGPANYDGAIYGFTWSGAGGSFGPTLDGQVMTHDPFYPTAAAISKNKPLMVGYNHDEMNFFFAQGGAAEVYSMTDATLKQRLDAQFGSNADRILAAYKKSRPDASAPDLYVAISTAQFDVIGSTLIAGRKYEQHGAPVYMYCFAHESQRLIPGTNHIYGAAHAGEIVYKFDNVPAPQTGDAGQRNPATNTFGDSSASSLACAHNMSQMWSSFARTGHPMADGQPAWTAYSVPQRATLFIDAQCKVEDDPGRLEREVWEAIIPGDKIVPA